MGPAGKLVSLAGRWASQSAELPWPADRCGGHRHGCPGTPRGGERFWAGVHRVVRLGGDRHAARKHKHGDTDRQAILFQPNSMKHINIVPERAITMNLNKT